MGHRNSSSHIHDAYCLCSDGGGPSRVAAGVASLKVTAVKQFSSKKAWASRAAAWVLLAGIRFYQAVFAPVMPVGCKFYPSCSRYAAEAVARHGAAQGVLLAAARLWRCRPFTQGGFDPVPDVDANMSELFSHGLRDGAGSTAHNEVGS
jgi:uncharacterized protein